MRFTTDELKMKIANAVKTMRLKKGWTQRTLSDMSGCSLNAVRHIEKDGSSSIHTLVQIMQSLEKTDWIMFLSPEISINPLHMVKGRPRRRGLRGQRKLREPIWLTADDRIKISKIYEKATQLTKSTGVQHVVDHVVPLNGELISGLHVPSNLQIITKSQNSRKHNRFEK